MRLCLAAIKMLLRLCSSKNYAFSVESRRLLL